MFLWLLNCLFAQLLWSMIKVFDIPKLILVTINKNKQAWNRSVVQLREKRRQESVKIKFLVKQKLKALINKFSKTHTDLVATLNPTWSKFMCKTKLRSFFGLFIISNIQSWPIFFIIDFKVYTNKKSKVLFTKILSQFF